MRAHHLHKLSEVVGLEHTLHRWPRVSRVLEVLRIASLCQPPLKCRTTQESRQEHYKAC